MQFDALADERTYGEVCDFVFLFLGAFRHCLEMLKLLSVVQFWLHHVTTISIGNLSARLSPPVSL